MRLNRGAAILGRGTRGFVIAVGVDRSAPGDRSLPVGSRRQAVPARDFHLALGAGAGCCAQEMVVQSLCRGEKWELTISSRRFRRLGITGPKPGYRLRAFGVATWVLPRGAFDFPERYDSNGKQREQFLKLEFIVGASGNNSTFKAGVAWSESANIHIWLRF